ncbi:uncharacterized protein LOC125473289 isoform X1 [Pyrus x bretschneideri]|uniref:uncharacterized protein LOC125473289 isoform X1 n=1 Tax=Pyrus x bretschneideri TaxID=225117 RepID=UPI00202F2CFF|nr:uncharacterized protein LOC125473289 isoform X1 [Pyrus x bretschneideri]
MVVRESLSFVHLDFLLLSFNDIYVLKRTIYHFLFHAITESGLLIWLVVEAQNYVFTLFPIFIYNNNIYDNLLFASRFARKVEAQVWIAGLKALISSGRGGRSKIDGWSDGGLYLDVLQDGKHLTSNSRSDSSASGARDSGSPDYEFKLKVFS